MEDDLAARIGAHRYLLAALLGRGGVPDFAAVIDAHLDALEAAAGPSVRTTTVRVELDDVLTLAAALSRVRLPRPWWQFWR